MEGGETEGKVGRLRGEYECGERGLGGKERVRGVGRGRGVGEEERD